MNTPGGTDRKIILKWLRNTRYIRVPVDPSATRYDPVVCTCERGNWPSIHIKDAVYSDRETASFSTTALVGERTFHTLLLQSFELRTTVNRDSAHRGVARCFVHYSRQSISVYQGLKQPSVTNTVAFVTVYSNNSHISKLLISMLKYIKIFKGTPTCFDLNRSSSGSRPVPR